MAPEPSRSGPYLGPGVGAMVAMVLGGEGASMIRFSLGVILLLALPVGAEALRCQHGLVAPGDHKVEVLAACGEPVFREEVVDYPFRVTRGGGLPHVEVLPYGLVSEEWVYDFGRQRFRQLLRFRNNRLVTIETLSKP